MKKKKGFKHYKFLIGLILGVIVSATGAYAATIYASNNIYYINTNSTLTSNNVQGAIDELAAKYTTVTECPPNKICTQLKTLEVGDYVSYKSSYGNFTTDANITGISSDTIKPQELVLWRVLRINADNTVEIISHYVSSVKVCFKSQTGYINSVGYLNVLASKYINSNYALDSRIVGYVENGQTEYITDTDSFNTVTPPWTCSTGDTGCDAIESKGGGDTLYESDYNLIYTALNSRVACKVDATGTATAYWVASRKYSYSSSSSYSWMIRAIGTNGSLNAYAVLYSSGSSGDTTKCNSLRPIVTLKSTNIYRGQGTKASPMEIIG